MTDFKKPTAYKNTTTSEIKKQKLESDSSSSVTKTHEGFFSTLGKTFFGE